MRRGWSASARRRVRGGGAAHGMRAMRAGFCVLVLMLALPAPAVAASGWLAPVPLSGDALNAQAPQLAMSPNGRVLTNWFDDVTRLKVHEPGGDFTSLTLPDAPLNVRTAFEGETAIAAYSKPGSDPTTSRLLLAERAPGASFGEAVPVTPTDHANGPTALAVSPTGGVVVLWNEQTGSNSYTLLGSRRPPGGSFGAPETLAGPSTSFINADVAIGAQGQALAAWSRNDGGTYRVETSFRPPNGPFGPAKELTNSTTEAYASDVAFDAEGNAMVAYLRHDGTLRKLFATYRPAGQDFGPPKLLSQTTTHSANRALIGFDALGTATVAWDEKSAMHSITRPRGGDFGEAKSVSPADQNAFAGGDFLAVAPSGAAVITWTQDKAYVSHRPAGGDFGPPQPVGERFVVQGSTSVVADAAGNFALGYRRDTGERKQVEVAGFDGAPPLLSGLSIPPAGTVGTPLTFGVTAVDVWGPVTTGWTFGDGGTATGTQVQHSFAAPGASAVAVTATDAVGNAVGGTGAVNVLPEAVKPILSMLKLSPNRFRSAAKGSTLATAKIGAKLSFKLSEDARVKFTVERATRGRRSGARCIRPRSQRRRAPACTRWVPVRGSASFAARQGMTTKTFGGRIGNRRLPPGSYRAVLVATDAAGNASAPARVKFTIAPRA